jgi:hypothetical protein
MLTRAIHEQIVNPPPFGLRPAPVGALAQDEPGLVLSKLFGNVSKPARTPLAFWRAGMSESAAFTNNPG